MGYTLGTRRNLGISMYDIFKDNVVNIYFCPSVKDESTNLLQTGELVVKT